MKSRGRSHSRKRRVIRLKKKEGQRTVSIHHRRRQDLKDDLPMQEMNVWATISTVARHSRPTVGSLTNWDRKGGPVYVNMPATSPSSG